MTRTYRANLLISHHTFLQLEDPNQYAMRVIDRVRARGKSAFVSVYEVFESDLPEQRSGKLRSKTQFERALMFYYNNRHGDALELFRECLNICPSDAIARSYLKRCRQRTEHG
jgi:hypothetical protein